MGGLTKGKIDSAWETLSGGLITTTTNVYFVPVSQPGRQGGRQGERMAFPVHATLFFPLLLLLLPLSDHCFGGKPQ